MGSGYSPTTPVLYFRPRAHVARSKPEYILWPAWVYRVVAPLPRARPINVLEKAVLGLACAGVRRAEEVGARLHLATDLAAYILVDLMEHGLLSDSGEPTLRGRELLLDELTESDQMTVGHIFQDPFSQELWPHLVDRLQHAERDFGNGEFPALMLGTTGKPFFVRPFMHLPQPYLTPTRPEASAILRACQQYRARLRYRAEMERAKTKWAADADLAAEADGFDDDSADPVQLGRISFVDETPQPVFLTSYLYLPDSADAEILSEGWFACDPFGLGASPTLRRRIEAEMPHTPLLREVVERLIGQPVKERQQQQRAMANDLHNQAEHEVEKRLTLSVRDWPGYAELVELECSRLEVELLGNAAPDYKLRAVVGALRRVLEQSFTILAERHPLGTAWQRLYSGDQPLQDGDLLRAHYDRATGDLGLQTPLPERLAGVRPAQVRAACGTGNAWRLRPLIIATLLRAADDMLHPLRRAAGLHPCLLVDLDQLAELGGMAAHAGKEQLARSRVSQAVNQTYHLVALLADLPMLGT